MRILFLCTAFNSLSQRLALELQAREHLVTVEFALSAELMIDAVDLAQPDLVICPFLTKRVPAAVYERYLTLIVHPGPPGDAGPSAIDLALFGDTGELASWDEQLALINFRHKSSAIVPRMRSHWGVTVLQAIEAFDAGPVVAFDQFELDPTLSATKSDLYRGQITTAAVNAVLAALSRLGTLPLPLPVDLPSSIITMGRRCVSLNEPFLGGSTHDRPLLKAATRDFASLISPDSPRSLSADIVAQRINSSDSQPGAQTALLGAPLFVYGAHVQSGPLSPLIEARWKASQPGAILATRQSAILIDAGADRPVWLTHLRRPKAKSDRYLHPKLPAEQALLSTPALGSKLDGVPEWHLGDDDSRWARHEGTYQQVWVDLETYGDKLVGYVHFEFYNGATDTAQCELLSAALHWTLARPGLSAIVLLGGKGYFSNGIALNVIEGSADAAAESWANINAIDDCVKAILAPSGVLTFAALRGNAAAGGLALATAADIVLCDSRAVLNPHYRSLGLFGSEYHTYSWFARCGAKAAKSLCRSMLPMSAEDALQVGLVDFIVGQGDESAAESLRLVKRTVASVMMARRFDGSPNRSSRLGAGARWTQPLLQGNAAEVLSFDNEATTANDDESLAASMLRNKATYLGLLCSLRSPLNSSRPFSIDELFQTFRRRELDEMRLDFFHPVRSQRYHTRRLAFVRKLAPTATPTRFALHRRFGAQWEERVLGLLPSPQHFYADDEEMDSFDELGGVAESAAVPRMPGGGSFRAPRLSSTETDVSELRSRTNSASTAPSSPRGSPRQTTKTTLSWRHTRSPSISPSVSFVPNIFSTPASTHSSHNVRAAPLSPSSVARAPGGHARRLSATSFLSSPLVALRKATPASPATNAPAKSKGGFKGGLARIFASRGSISGASHDGSAAPRAGRSANSRSLGSVFDGTDASQRDRLCVPASATAPQLSSPGRRASEPAAVVESRSSTRLSVPRAPTPSSSTSHGYPSSLSGNRRNSGLGLVLGSGASSSMSFHTSGEPEGDDEAKPACLFPCYYEGLTARA